MANNFCKESDIDNLLQDDGDFGVAVDHEDHCKSIAMNVLGINAAITVLCTRLPTYLPILTISDPGSFGSLRSS